MHNNQYISDMFSDYPDLLNVIDMQKVLGISRTMSYRLINGGAINHLRIGKNIKIPKQCIIDFIKESCYNEGSKFAVSERR